jgi:hypothetical protein
MAIMGMTASLAACAPKPAPPPAAPTLDCGLGFAALSAKIAATPGIKAAPADPSEPYSYYSTADGQASYFVTQKDAPAHPAVLMQQVTPQGEKNTGCAFGDKAAYDKLMDYLVHLKDAHR